MSSELSKITKLLGISTAILLAACGGGGGGSSSSSGGGVVTPPGGGTVTPPGGGTSGGGTSGGGTVTPPADTSDGTPRATVTRTSNGCSIDQATGGFQDKGLNIEEVNWIQVVQQNVTDPNLRLVANKELRLRVDVTASATGKALPSSATLRVALASGGCRDYTLTTSATTAPLTIDRTTLRFSYVAVIPAADVTSNLKSVQFAIDAIRESTPAAADRLYVELPLNIGAEVKEDLIIMPIAFEGETGAFASNTQMADLIRRTLPGENVVVTTQSPITTASLTRANALLVNDGVYTFGYQRMLDALNEVENSCFSLNTGFAQVAEATKCAAAFPSNIRFIDDRSGGSGSIVGLAYVGGLSLLSTSFAATDNLTVFGPYGAAWLNTNATTFIHEFSHVNSLDHANCGSPGGVDASLYADGTLGDGGGYDVGRNFYFSGPGGGFYDVMSYCGNKLWTSDKGYQKVVNYKNAIAPTPSTVGARTTSADETPASSQKGIRLARIGGVWKAHRVMIPTTAVDSVYATDGGYISSAFKGLPVKTLNSDLGQNVNGPFFIPANDQLLQALANGLIPGITVK